jgi:hypothetical protein
MVTAREIDSWRKGRPIWVTKQGYPVRALYEDWECGSQGLLVRYRIQELLGAGVRLAMPSDVRARDLFE